MSYFDSLLEELSRATAPVTNRRVACAIVHKDKIFFGHNDETGLPYLHAECQALGESPLLVGLYNVECEVHIVGDSGIKAVVPCEECAKRLSAHLSPESKIFLYRHTGGGENYCAKLGDIVTAYVPSKEMKQVVVDANFVESIQAETSLSSKDAIFLHQFLLGLSERLCGIHFDVYLSGSAAGFGPRKLYIPQIIGKPYGDLDLVIIISRQYWETIGSIISETYGVAHGIDLCDTKFEEKSSYILEEKERAGDSQDFLFRREFFVPKSDELQIDVSVGADLDAVATKQYLSNNWFVRFSF